VKATPVNNWMVASDSRWQPACFGRNSWANRAFTIMYNVVTPVDVPSGKMGLIGDFAANPGSAETLTAAAKDDSLMSIW
jgi:hypothetical protein